MQPHGFFNCSPAVDVPPSSCDSDVKDNGNGNENGNGVVVTKPLQNALLAKL